MARAAVPVLRTATVKDLDSIGAVMQASVLALFPPYYDERQTASAAVHIAHVDPVLVADGTYFVFVAGGEIVACGGGAAGAGSTQVTAATRTMIVFSIPPPRPHTFERCLCAVTGPGADWAGRFLRPAETRPAPKASNVWISARPFRASRCTEPSDLRRSSDLC